MLSRRAKIIKVSITTQYALDAWESELLEQALEALDRAEQARAAVGDQLLVADARGGEKANPLLLVERDARMTFARLLKQLGLGDPGGGQSSSTSFPRRRVTP